MPTNTASAERARSRPGRVRFLRVLSVLVSLIIVIILAASLSSCVQARRMRQKNVLKPGATEVQALTGPQRESLPLFLREKGQSPVAYVKAKFKDHDVVLLGEIHEVRETCEFISELVSPLYREAGVRVFGMECLKYKNSGMANQLVTGKTFDEQLCLALFRDCSWPCWGFREYADILKAIWKVNQRRPEGAEPMRVIGLEPDVNMYDFMCGHWWNKVDDLFKMVGNDKFMTKVLSQEVFDKKQRALVQVGRMHSFTRYRQPAVVRGKLVAEVSPRMGYLLREKYGNRVFQVCLHQWDLGSDPDKENVLPPLGGVLEQAFARNGNAPVGFDVENSPFALLRDNGCYWYAFQNYVTFLDTAEGYVFFKPLRELHKVTWIDGFINEENFKKAKGIALAKGWVKAEQCESPEQLNRVFKRVTEN